MTMTLSATRFVEQRTKGTLEDQNESAQHKKERGELGQKRQSTFPKSRNGEGVENKTVETLGKTARVGPAC
jgi:hypothetical protein